MKKIKALLYCTKAKPYLYKETTEWATNPISYGLYTRTMGINTYLNGTIVAECEIDWIDIIKVENQHNNFEETYAYLESNPNHNLYKSSCLDEIEISNYLDKGTGYALHISNLKVFDEPRDLINYHTLCNGENESKCRKCFYHYITSNEGAGLEEECLCDNKPSLLKAPQNMMNVYDRLGNHYVLISIQPQWLCKILNGEKDIEIRKQVLNCMKGKE